MCSVGQRTDNREVVHDRIWSGMLDAERLSRYYGNISDRQQKWNQSLSLASIMLSIVGAIILLWTLPAWVVAGVFLALAFVTSLMMVFDFSRRAETARIVSRQMRNALDELRDLWTDRLTADTEYLSSRVAELEKRMNSDTFVDLVVDDKLNERCQKEADDVLRAEFSRA